MMAIEANDFGGRVIFEPVTLIGAAESRVLDRYKRRRCIYRLACRLDVETEILSRRSARGTVETSESVVVYFQYCEAASEMLRTFATIIFI